MDSLRFMLLLLWASSIDAAAVINWDGSKPTNISPQYQDTNWQGRKLLTNETLTNETSYSNTSCGQMKELKRYVPLQAHFLLFVALLFSILGFFTKRERIEWNASSLYTDGTDSTGVPLNHKSSILSEVRNQIKAKVITKFNEHGQFSPRDIEELEKQTHPLTHPIKGESTVITGSIVSGSTMTGSTMNR